MGTKAFISLYSEKNAKFYKNSVLTDMRKIDTMEQCLSEACEEIAKMCPDNIKYLGFHFEDSDKKSRELNKGVETAISKTHTAPPIMIEETYAKLAYFEFELNCDGIKMFKRLPIWIPLLIDNCHFYIKGNKYSAPLQIVDAITFSNKSDMLILKTMTRAIKIMKSKTTIVDIYGKEFRTHTFYIHHNRTTKIPFLLYYFAHFGFFKTLTFFGLDNIVSLYEGDKTNVPADKYIFQFGSVFIGVNKENFDNNILVRQIVACILSTLKGKRSFEVDSIRNPAKWMVILGDQITTNPQKTLEKGEGLLKTFISSYDFRTQTIINKLIDDGEPKTNMFMAIRWLFIRFNQRSYYDNSLQNKRIRFNEYLISPYVREVVDKVYRFMNSTNRVSMKGDNGDDKKAERKMNKLLDIFKISPFIIVNSIVGKISVKKTGMNVVKYSSLSNDNVLAGPLSEYTFAGPGAPSTSKSGKRSSSVNNKFSPDYLGNICIITASNREPGVTGQLTPNPNIDKDKGIFVIKPQLMR